MVATFPYERGRVLHAMGHVYQQEGNVTGTAGVQRLALNFVRMRLEQGGTAAATTTALADAAPASDFAAPGP